MFPPALTKSRICFAVKLGPRPRAQKVQSHSHISRLREVECTFGLGWEEDDVVICSLSQVFQLQVLLFGSRMADLEASAY